MLAYPDRVQLIEMSGTGHNALDFHIAYYAGRIAVSDPGAYLHIISKDKGFDPLIAHLKASGIFARRSNSVDEIAILHAPDVSKMSFDQRIQRVTDHLQATPQSRPRKRKTLVSSIAALFGKQLDDDDVCAIITAMEASGRLEIDGKDAVTYRL